MSAGFASVRQWDIALAGVQCTWRVQYLVIVRQSGVHQIAALASMLERTITTHIAIPGAHKILSAGLGPLLSPTGFPDARSFRLPGGGRAALWVQSGTYVLYVLGSAAKSDLVRDTDGTERNAVSVLFRKVLEALRPEEVLTGPFDRLVRSFKHDSSTYTAFRDNVRVLRHASPGKVIDFRSSDHLSQWRKLSNDAITVHEATTSRLGEGRASAARMGRVPMSGKSVPAGTRLVGGRFELNPDELPWVSRAVELIAAPGFTAAAAARTLVAEGHVGYRTGPGPGKRMVGDGFVVPTGSQAEVGRARERLDRLIELLPDMFLGKYVTNWTQTDSAEGEYLGLRRVFNEDGSYVHRLVYDIPDALVGVAEETLLRAVQVSVTRKRKRGLPPSEWLVEVEARRQARELLASPDADPLDRDDVVRWAGTDGGWIDRLAPSVPARQHVLEDIIAEVARNSEGGRRPPKHERNRLLVGLPAWVDAEGFEWVLTFNSKNYAVLRREPDRTLEPEASLARAWEHRTTNVGRGYVVAAVPMLELHAGIARAVAAAIERGALLAPRQRSIAPLAGAVVDQGDVARAIEMAEVENQLRATKARARAALQVMLDLQARRQAYESLDAAEVNAGRLVGLDGGVSEAMLEAHAQAENALWVEVSSLQRRLESLAEPEPEPEPAFFDPAAFDLDVVLEVLAWLAQTEMTKKEAVAQLQALIPEFRVVQVSTFFVEFSVKFLLPGADGTVGKCTAPILGRVRTAGALTPDGTTKAQAITEYLCVDSLFAGDLHTGSPRSVPGRKAALTKEELARHAAQRQLVHLGMTKQSAWNLLTCPLLPLRTIVWSLLNDLPIDNAALGVDDPYIELVRQTFLSGRDLKVQRYGSDRRPRQALLDVILEAGGLIKNHDLLAKSYLADTPNKQKALSLLSSRLNHCPEQRQKFTGYVRRGNDRLYAPRTCPHCEAEGKHSFLDMVVWVPEVKSGLLCSRCLRQPTENSIIYPDFYRGLPSKLAAYGKATQPVDAADETAGVEVSPPRSG